MEPNRARLISVVSLVCDQRMTIHKIIAGRVARLRCSNRTREKKPDTPGFPDQPEWFSVPAVRRASARFGGPGKVFRCMPLCDPLQAGYGERSCLAGFGNGATTSIVARWVAFAGLAPAIAIRDTVLGSLRLRRPREAGCPRRRPDGQRDGCSTS
jgi:hypothetical protein